ncbi:unnamed protein product [Caenorhabditis auriculariae]|uniref:Uncharacterized protein n=1 Tax=Caenorhabditis auriculariae TaxID=2777116 RepID=A0A8S1GRF4_9PELO|nr:unnamed protein product [Caenorhabditis auriculariae]
MQKARSWSQGKWKKDRESIPTSHRNPKPCICTHEAYRHHHHHCRSRGEKKNYRRTSLGENFRPSWNSIPILETITNIKRLQINLQPIPSASNRISCASEAHWEQLQDHVGLLFLVLLLLRQDVVPAVVGGPIPLSRNVARARPPTLILTPAPLPIPVLYGSFSTRPSYRSPRYLRQSSLELFCQTPLTIPVSYGSSSTRLNYSKKESRHLF